MIVPERSDGTVVNRQMIVPPFRVLKERNDGTVQNMDSFREGPTARGTEPGTMTNPTERNHL